MGIVVREASNQREVDVDDARRDEMESSAWRQECYQPNACRGRVEFDPYHSRPSLSADVGEREIGRVAIGPRRPVTSPVSPHEANRRTLRAPMDSGWEITTAARLDDVYRSDVARLTAPEPWFGEVAIRTERRTVLSRIGKVEDRTHQIVDWRHPYGRAFFELQPGDDFAMEDFVGEQGGFADIQGVCTHRAQVSGPAGELERVVLAAEGGHCWELEKSNGCFAPASAQAKRPDSVEGLPDVTSLLTAEQYRLITQSRHRPLIIQGRAGSGKTSVALFRVAWLAYPGAEAGEPPIDPSKVLIVMFNKALSAFAAHSLAPLKLGGVHLSTFHAWALTRIREAYAGKIEVDPSHDGEGRTAAVRVKKHIGILGAIEAFVASQTQNMLEYLAKSLAPYDKEGWLEKAKSSSEAPATMLRRLRSEALIARNNAKGRRATRLEQVYKVFDATIRRFTLYKDELFRLLTDTELLATHCKGIAHDELVALAEFQRGVQLKDGDRKKPGPNIAFEDFALLLRLIQLKNGGYPEGDGIDPFLFDHLVIDEAQDFGAVELKVILASVRSRTGVTIVGDLNQKIVPDANFLGWDGVAAELGIEGAEVAKLEVSHRSSARIIAVADRIAGTQTRGGFEGAAPQLALTDDEEASIETVHTWAADVLSERPHAHVCVVCRWPKQVKGILGRLAARFDGSGIDVREGHNSSFVFAPGVTVTSALQIKGLEFDAVAILDPVEKFYPDTEDGQRLLYTVVTRAKERLLFVTHHALSPLVQALVDDGLVEEEDEASVEEFHGEDDTPFDGSVDATIDEFIADEDDPF